MEERLQTINPQPSSQRGCRGAPGLQRLWSEGPTPRGQGALRDESPPHGRFGMESGKCKLGSHLPFVV